MREGNREAAGGINKVPPLQLPASHEGSSKNREKGEGRSAKKVKTNGGRTLKRVNQARALIKFKFENAKQAEAARLALLPEKSAQTGEMCGLDVRRKKNVLCLEIEASDTAALRAAINSSVRWIMVIEDMMKLGRE